MEVREDTDCGRHPPWSCCAWEMDTEDPLYTDSDTEKGEMNQENSHPKLHFQVSIDSGPFGRVGPRCRLLPTSFRSAHLLLGTYGKVGNTEGPIGAVPPTREHGGAGGGGRRQPSQNLRQSPLPRISAPHLLSVCPWAASSHHHRRRRALSCC